MSSIAFILLHGMAVGVSDRQLMGTHVVDIGVTGGGGAVVVLVRPSMECARNGIHRYRQVVPVHKADVVKIHALVLVEGDLGECGRQRAPCPVTFNFAA